MKYLIGFLALVGIAACGTEATTDNDVIVVKPTQPAGLVYADVKPIFDARCVGCHGADKPKEGIRLDSHDAIMKGGEKGPIIVAGKANESELVHVIDGTDEPRMPFKQDPLTAEEIKKIADWIDQGAKP